MTRPNRGRPRVLMTADAVGGVWAYALTLARALGARAEILLAVMGPPPSEAQQRDAAAIPGLGFVHGNYRLEWMPDAAMDLPRAAEWLGNLALAFRPDIVHVNGYAAAAERWTAPVVSVAHSCVLSWWCAVHGKPAPAEWSAYAGRVALALARADRVVAPSEAMLSALSLHYGLPRGGRVIENGAALDRFAPAPKEKFILAAGRLWDEGKNLAALDAAARRLAWPVVIAGDHRHPDGRRWMPQAARPLGPLAPDALAGWMAHAALYALPARYEPFGLSVLEAAASGAALVLGDIPSLRELWEGAALFVPPDDSAGLAAAIDRLMRDDRRRQSMARAAQERAQRFSAAAMAQHYLDLYGELAPGFAAAPEPAPAEAV